MLKIMHIFHLEINKLPGFHIEKPDNSLMEIIALITGGVCNNSGIRNSKGYK
jgi:hypothetical protein